ncbi:MAG: M14 family zinc carboxypeptidase, partial [Bacteroidota bacterium]
RSLASGIGMTASTNEQNLPTLARELFERYDRFKLADIASRRFTQAEMVRWLKPLEAQKTFESTPAGTSAEGRTISLLAAGGGKTTVLLWSQMHGDEPTATMALIDILNFFAQSPDDRVVQAIREMLTLLMIPMLNPDGAERFQRRTAQMIDMNRDALKLETPEARILRDVQERHRPEFGFNLHDQDPRYTVGSSKDVAAIALLAPAMDEKKSEPPTRVQAKQVAATFAETMNLFVANHVTRFDDMFEPRAFGDTMQKSGTSTVLVESGGWPNDRDKMFLRKLNVVGLLTSLYAIATGAYREATLASYEQLPFNGKNLYDVIVRNAKLRANNSAPAVNVDIGINIEEQRDETTGRILLFGKIMDLGDLSTFGAFEEHDGTSLVLTDSQVRLEKMFPFRKGGKFF